jgi:long-chain fatty acid transport protein
MDFQWPQMIALGLAWRPNAKTLLVADVKHLGWASVMKNFTMQFTAQGSGDQLRAVLFQNWENQTVVMLGGAYRYSEALTLRAGVNLSDNPVPDETVNYLFPAIIKNHLTAGLGYQIDNASSVDMSYVYAPKVSVTNRYSGIKTEHAQHSNWQLMYSYRF